MSRAAEWTAVSRVHDDATAHSVFIGSLDVRLMAAARSRVDGRGHAHFGRAELVGTLTTLKASSGELVTPAPSTVRRAIGRLVTWGLLDEGSTVQCLRTPADHAWIRLKVAPENHRRCPVDGLSVEDIRKAKREEERAVTRTEARRVLHVVPARGRYGRRDVEPDD